MNLKRLATAALGLSLVSVWPAPRQDLLGQARNEQVPIFEYDPTFPKPMPENWAIGPIGGLAVDRQDHLYVVQRPGVAARRTSGFTGADDTPPKADCCVPAPPVLEFDQSRHAGPLVGRPGPGYDWPQTEHGVFVDHKDNVWLAGSGEKDAQLLKFTREGKFLQQFGKPGMSGGSADTKNMGQPANLTVDPVTERGLRGRRLPQPPRHRARRATRSRSSGCGAPTATSRTTRRSVPTIPMRRRRSSSACRTTSPISRDGFVYVADRPNNRIQVFRKDGTYVKETFVSKRTLLQGAASGFALSTDPQQRLLYMIDGANHHVWILKRQSLQVVARFGQQGLLGGSLNVPHAIAVDSRGNIYVGENFDARRFQRFLYKGLGTPVAGANPPTTIVR